MNDVGKEKMVECLRKFSTSQKVGIEIDNSEYIKLANQVEMLLCDEYKVLHFPNADSLSIHYNGQEIPCGIIKL